MEVKEVLIHYRLSAHVTDHPGICRRCSTTIVTRSGLIATLDGRPVCGECLLQAEPRLGWALALAESAASSTGGRWASTPEGEELAPVIDVIQTAARVVGPLFPGNPRLAQVPELSETVNATVTRQVARMLDRLEALATERGVELDVGPDLTMDDLLRTLERLDVEPRDFFAHLWRTERDARSPAGEKMGSRRDRARRFEAAEGR